jgi:O-antigen/teichoic acid export membrane protein
MIGPTLIPFDRDGNLNPGIASEGLRAAAIRGAGITLLGQGASFALQIASTMITARLLSPNDFGVVTMVTTFSLLLRSFGLNGFTELITQREELTHKLASNLFWIDLGIGTILTLGFAGSGPLLAAFYHNAAVGHITLAMSLTIGLGCLGWIHMGLLQRAMRFKTIATINLVGFSLYAFVTVGLALAGWGYWALVWGMVTHVVATAAGACIACRWVPSWPRRTPGTGSGFKFAMNVYAHYAFWYLTRNTDNLLVGWRFGAGALGFYKKAYDLFVLPQMQLLAPMSGVVVSTLSRVHQNREQYQRYLLRTISVLALLGMGIGFDFALVGKDIIRFLLGPGWDEAGRIFELFGPGIGIGFLYHTHGWIHLSIGRPERWLRWGLLEFVSTASLFLLGLHWGPSGVALAWTASYFLLMFPGFWYAGKPIGLNMGPIFATIGRFFAASAGAGFGTALIIKALPYFATVSGARGALVRMISVSFVFLGLYIVAVITLHQGVRPLSEAVSLFREFLPKRAGLTGFRGTVDSEEVLADPVGSEL